MSAIKHVAIIMDGNGRWANLRQHSRVWGHVRGSSVVAKIVEEADDLGLEALTLYAFSTENWSRPLLEVNSLFSLLKKFLKREKERILKNEIRFRVVGDVSRLPVGTQKLITDLMDETKNNKGIKLTFAFGYGGRSEILSAVNSYINENPGQGLTEADLEERLFAPDLGNVDLLIRTGGEKRISNFLLWQVAYAELYFTETKWPEFKREEFRKIIELVTKRERRFGTVESCQSLDSSALLAQKNISTLQSLSTGQN
jgi:undecaprenyl diphosphate synthase